jgi:hypothetical protein
MNLNGLSESWTTHRAQNRRGRQGTDCSAGSGRRKANSQWPAPSPTLTYTTTLRANTDQNVLDTNHNGLNAFIYNIHM